MPAPASTTPAPGSNPADPPPMQTADLIASLPGPIIRLLVIFARPITLLRAAVEILSWKPGRRVESWIVVGIWWGLCLGSTHAFKYLLPPLLFLPLLPLSTLKLSQPSASEKTPAASTTLERPETNTQETLLHTLSDLHSVHAMLPPSPLPTVSSIYERFRQLGPLRLTRGLLVLWTVWLVLGRIVGYRALLALIGSVLLTLPSPPLAHLYNLLSKSLAVRRGLALAFLFAFGSPPDQSFSIGDWSLKSWLKAKWTTSRRPSLAFSFRPKVAPGDKSALSGSAVEDETEEKAGSPIFFRFEVHENQRWWMGLDWTSALLPQERPSWCDSHLLPVPPPPSYTLPPSTSVVLPAPTKSDPNAKVKRTATWRWVDDDWSIVRAGAGKSSSPAAPAVSSVPVTGQESEAEGFSMGQSPPRPSASMLGTSPTASAESTLFATSRAQSIAEQAFTKGLERLKTRTTSPVATTKVPASPRGSFEISRARTGSQASEDIPDEAAGQGSALSTGGAPAAVAAVPVPQEVIAEKDDATDADGWVYGDNKWENMGPRGGLGKFTRRRRWQRRAMLTETVVRLPSGAEPGLVTSVVPPKSSPTVGTSVAHVEPAKEPVRGRSTERTTTDTTDEKDKEVVTVVPSSSTTSREDILRRRLKNAMGSVGG